MQASPGQEGFLKLLDAHRGILYKVANAYCTRREERGDLVQDIIVELWRAFPRYDPTRAAFSTWMYRIALNVAISAHRGAGRRVTDALSLDLSSMDFAAADRELASGDDSLQALQQLISTLDEISRALVLLYLEGYEQDEIAELTGLTASNVSTRLHRIKLRLHEQARSGKRS